METSDGLGCSLVQEGKESVRAAVYLPSPLGGHVECLACRVTSVAT